MLDHHLQRSIVYRLAFSDALRFTELKPDTVENKLFDYHLKKVIAAGYVLKDDAGLYSLAPEGKRLGIRVLDKQQVLVDRAESVLFLVIRRKADGAWLLYKRNTHPLKDRVGFMHATPVADADSASVASRVCRETTGLVGNFTYQGGGFFRVYKDAELESFTHFALLVCEDAVGELVPHDDYAEYFWVDDPDFSAPEMLPNMVLLNEYYAKGELFFLEKTLQVAIE